MGSDTSQSLAQLMNNNAYRNAGCSNSVKAPQPRPDLCIHIGKLATASVDTRNSLELLQSRLALSSCSSRRTA